MRRLLPLGLALALVALAAGLRPTPAAAKDAEAQWTVFVYHDADCNLEAPMIQDLEEMLAVGSSDAVQVVALVDRHPGAEEPFSGAGVGGLKDWSSAKLCHVEKGKLVELADWGEANLGNPTTLTRLLAEGVARFPAHRYALILGDHGMSWPGICADDSNQDDFLDLAELAKAIGGFAKEHGPFELLGFDACVMASLEVAHAMAPFAKTLVASEELEPGTGWDYTATLSALEASPDMDGLALGRVIADAFKASFAKPPEELDPQVGATVTLSVVDLSKVAAVTKATAALAAVLGKAFAEKGRDAWLPVARARAKAEEYGRSADPSAEGMALFDLADLAAHLAKSDAAGARTAAEAVAKAVREAVTHTIRGSARPSSNGLSLYFPRSAQRLPAAYAGLGFAEASGWAAALHAFGTLTDGDAAQPALAAPEAAGHELEPGATLTLTAGVADADDVDESSFVLAVPQDGGPIVLGSVPTELSDDGKLSETWDGGWFALAQGEKHLIVPITGFDEADETDDVGEGQILAEVPGQVRFAGTEGWTDVTMTFLLEDTPKGLQGDFLYAVAFEQGAPRELELDPGDAIRAVYLQVRPDGSFDLVASSDEAAILTITDEKTLSVVYERVPAGAWNVGFLVTDLAGNASLQTLPATVK